MLKSLIIERVGPAEQVVAGLGSRLNVITGDNGVGKSLLLEIAWYALTGTWSVNWPGKGVIPARAAAALEWNLCKPPQGPHRATFDFSTQQWQRLGPEITPALVIYARVDGGYSVHDPYRSGLEYRHTPVATGGKSTPSIQFGADQVWEGLPGVGSPAASLCEGLLRDWQRWASNPGDPAFKIYCDAVATMAADMKIVPLRTARRLYIDDARDVPLIDTETGEMPVVHASAAIRRILAFVYVVVWAWRENRVIAGLQKRKPIDSIVVLFDEIEGHLHPQWQRRIAPALLKLSQALDEQCTMQSIITTHSPMVLASLETHFSLTQDRLFNIEVRDRRMELQTVRWAKQGDAVNWLVSSVFGLQQGRSLEAERVIEAAEAWMRGDRDELQAPLDSAAAIDKELRRVLADQDDFWPRWVVQQRKSA